MYRIAECSNDGRDKVSGGTLEILPIYFGSWVSFSKETIMHAVFMTPIQPAQNVYCSSFDYSHSI